MGEVFEEQIDFRFHTRVGPVVPAAIAVAVEAGKPELIFIAMLVTAPIARVA